MNGSFSSYCVRNCMIILFSFQEEHQRKQALTVGDGHLHKSLVNLVCNHPENFDSTLKTPFSLFQFLEFQNSLAS